MLRAYSILLIICAGLIFTFYAQKLSFAQSVEEALVIPAPPPVEVPVEIIVTPAGSINCFKINEGWLKKKWVTEHRVCQYPKKHRNMAWVEEHWTCNQFDKGGVCSTWIGWSSGWTTIPQISKSKVSSHRQYTPRRSTTYFYPCVY